MEFEHTATPGAADATAGSSHSPFASAGASSQSPFTGANDCPHGHGELILLVDDDSTVRFVATKMLSMHGYRVLAAENGAEGVALYALRQTEIALVISDVLMPVMDGPTMIKRLHALNPLLRIIVASGSLGCGDTLKCLEPEVRFFLDKPYTTAALLQIVHNALAEASQPVP